MIIMQAETNDCQEPSDKFSILYQCYHKVLRKKAYAILKDILRAEDAVQWTYIKILNHMDDLGDAHSSLARSYLYTTLINVCRSMLKKNERGRLLMEKTKLKEKYIEFR